MQDKNPSTKPINPRTSPKIDPSGNKYVVKEGAPRHYIPGHSVVGPGAEVVLQPGVKPGKWLTAVDPKVAEADAAAAKAAAEAEQARIAAEQEAAKKAGEEAAKLEAQKTKDK